MFKYCSTFNSTPLGDVSARWQTALLESTWRRPSPSSARFFRRPVDTLYMGHLFVQGPALEQIRHGEATANSDDRPGHPPLAVTFSCVKIPIGHVQYSIVRQGTAAIRSALDQQGH